MPETPAKPDRKPPRFLWVQAVFCASCLGAAAWTWMRYSYAWTFQPSDFYDSRIREVGQWPDGAFVQMSGLFKGWDAGTGKALISDPEDWFDMVYAEPQAVPQGTRRDGCAVTVSGRVKCDERTFRRTTRGHKEAFFEIDSDASRFHGASVSGLIVGAMGVFVFTVALRHWLKERRSGERPTQTVTG